MSDENREYNDLIRDCAMKQNDPESLEHIQNGLRQLLEEYDSRWSWTTDVLNRYIDRYESFFVYISKHFRRGMRVKSGYNVERHYTIDGLLGIVSFNIEELRKLVRL